MTRQQQRAQRAAAHQLQQNRRGALRLDKDSLGRCNAKKRGPKSHDEGTINAYKQQASPQQLAFRALVESGMPAADARVEAGLPPLRWAILPIDRFTPVLL